MFRDDFFLLTNERTVLIWFQLPSGSFVYDDASALFPHGDIGDTCPESMTLGRLLD